MNTEDTSNLGRENHATSNSQELKKREKGIMPANKVGLLSFITANWLNGLMLKAYRSGLEQEDINELVSPNRIEDNADRIVRLWGDQVRIRGKAASLFKTTLRFIRTRLICLIILRSASSVLQFAGPTYIQRLILSFVGENKDTQPLSWGLSLVAMLFVNELLKMVSCGAAQALSIHTAIRVQGALQYLVYAKVLRLQASDKDTLGRILTFCSSEQERISESISMGAAVISVPGMLAVSIVFTYMELGYWALLGNFIVLSFYPIMGLVAWMTTSTRFRTTEQTDLRINLMEEILNSIKLIKMFAWEDCFLKNLYTVRMKERRELRISCFLSSFSITLLPGMAMLATVFTLIVQTATGNALLSTQAFTVLSAFQTLQATVIVLPFGLKAITEARVALNKIQKILLRPERQPQPEKNKNQMDLIAPSIDIKAAYFTWGDVEEDTYKEMCFVNTAFNSDEKNTQTKKTAEMSDGLSSNMALKDVNLTVHGGQLVGVCGAVGSGKSSLLAAIAGDLSRLQGALCVRGTLSIVPQQAWIFNATLRENILFGLPYEEKRFREVLRVCSLSRDMDLLSNGDLTEIGERGANLSGGQKQRVNLARAVYADKDVYLLDDPLSAVDARVAKQIFNNCIKEYLQSKTVVMITNSIQFLERCDQILFMKNGFIAERGTHEQLLSLRSNYVQMLSFDQTRAKKESEEINTEEIIDLDEEPHSHCGHLTSEENHTSYGFSGYIQYLKFCGGYRALFILITLVLLYSTASISNGIWLQIWLSAGDGLEAERQANWTGNGTLSKDQLLGSITDNQDLLFYQLIYGMTFVLMMIAGVMKGVAFAYYLIGGASRLHDAMLRKTMHCPTAFFDVTPPGRLLQRFSKDMDEIDVRLPYFMEFTCQYTFTSLAMMISVCVMFPVYTVVMALSIAILGFTAVLFSRGLTQTKTLDSLRWAPVLSHIGSTMAGLSVIRAHGCEAAQLRRFRHLVDSALASDLMYRSSVQWFSCRLDGVTLLLVTLTALAAVLSRGSATAAQGGLALSSMFSVCIILPAIMPMLCELRARFTSVERVLEYCGDLPQEGTTCPGPAPAPRWPERGGVVLDGVRLRYRPGLPLALRGLSAELRPGEKLGVVGRTGAGKSSLIAALLRLTELEAGRILVDGVDIARLELSQLRRGIAVIPQDPVLFEGTVRYNLDPFGEHDDDTIWEALEKSHVKQKIKSEEKQLLAPVLRGGLNLSVGEKQLLCMSRAIIRQSKILLLDEATASVDVETDFLIQRSLREVFRDCTVLIIAHRLPTVAMCDRVMVMDAGQVVELDTPAALLARKDSVFREMAQAAGMHILPH